MRNEASFFMAFSLLLVILGGESARGADKALLSMIQVMEQHEAAVESMAFDVQYSAPAFKWEKDRWVPVEIAAKSPLVPGAPGFPSGGTVARTATVIYDVKRSAFIVRGVTQTVGVMPDSTPVYSHYIETYADDTKKFVKYAHVFDTPTLPNWNLPPTQWPGVRDCGVGAVILTSANQSECLQTALTFLRSMPKRMASDGSHRLCRPGSIL